MRKPLAVRLVDGVLIIEIGVATLATAAINSPTSWQMMGEYPEMPETRFSIEEPVSFAQEVKRSLLEELGEDGNSILTNAIDKAIEKTIEDGSQFFLDKERHCRGDL